MVAASTTNRLDTPASPSSSADNAAAAIAAAKALTGTTSTQSSSGGKQTTDSTTNSSSQASSSQQNMTAQGLASLDALIKQLSGGGGGLGGFGGLGALTTPASTGTAGTATMKKDIANRDAIMAQLQALLPQYSTAGAMTDAAGAMALQLQQSLQAVLPQLARGAEGAGTSANSMQALLANQGASDAAMRSAAIGADQAKAYAGITSQLMSQLTGMAQTGFDPVTQALISALGINKGAVQNTSQSQSSQSNTSSTTNTGPSSVTTTTDPTNTGALASLLAGFTGGSLDPTTNSPSNSGSPGYSGSGSSAPINSTGATRIYKNANGSYSDTPVNAAQGVYDLFSKF